MIGLIIMTVTAITVLFKNTVLAIKKHFSGLPHK